MDKLRILQGCGAALERSFCGCFLSVSVYRPVEKLANVIVQSYTRAEHLR